MTRLSPQEQRAIDYYTRVRAETGVWPRSRAASAELGITVKQLGHIRYRLRCKGFEIGASGGTSPGREGSGMEPTASQVETLRLMAELHAKLGGWPTLAEIAARKGVMKTTVWHQMSQLMRKGLVLGGRRGYRLVGRTGPVA